LADAARCLQDLGSDILDIKLAAPSTGSGMPTAGSGLLRDLPLVELLLREGAEKPSPFRSP